MDVEEATRFIARLKPFIEKKLIWGDFGCGSGIFSQALSNLLSDGAMIYAIDKVKQNIALPANKEVKIEFIQADFEKDELLLPGLDGIVMANSFHYVEDKPALISRIVKHFKKSPAFLFVEYDSMQANTWVPYPIDLLHLEQLFKRAGFEQVIELGHLRSLYRGVNLYACYVA